MKTLNEKCYNYKGKLTPETDLNEIINPSTYRLDGAYTNAPSEGKIYGMLITITSLNNTWVPTLSTSWIWQIFLSTANNVYIRGGNGAFQSWTQLH